MLRKIMAVLASAVLATLLTLGFGNTAAMAGFNDCPAGEVCWWTNSNYTGAWGHRTGGNIGIQGCWSMGSVGNTASSFRTRLSAPYHGVGFSDGGTPGSCYGFGKDVGTAQSGTFADLGPLAGTGQTDNWLGGISVW